MGAIKGYYCWTGFSEETLKNVFWPPLIEFLAILRKTSNMCFYGTESRPCLLK